MRYLVFLNTPSCVHLHKHAIRRLESLGHTVRVLAREYGCTTDLLDYYRIPYETYGRTDTQKASLMRSLPRQYVRMVRLTRAFEPDVIAGVGAYAAHTGAITRTPTLLFHDSETSTLDPFISLPFATAMITPYTFRKDLGRKHYKFDGLLESAYLHPDVFERTVDIRSKLGLSEDDRFVILRFNAFGSHHDVGISGFTPEQKRTLIERLGERAHVFVSDERFTDALGGDARTYDLHPAYIHDALAEADLLVADTQTMVTEAGLLGTPAIRSNSFVGASDMGNFLELERRGLAYNEHEFSSVLSRAMGLLDGDSATAHLERRTAFVSDLVNTTDVILDAVTNVDSLDTLGSVYPVSSGHAENDASRPPETN